MLVSTIFNGGNLSHRQKSTNAVLYINCNRENQLGGQPNKVQPNCTLYSPNANK